MNKEVIKMLKVCGVWKMFLIMLILRSPFDILNSVIKANLMQCFIHMIRQNQKENLWFNVVLFFALSALLFGYNMSIWSTIAVKTTVLLQTKLRKKIYEKILDLSPMEMSEESKGDWFTALNNDVDNACAYLTSPLNYMHMVIALVNLVLSSIIMIFLNVELYVIGICCLLPFFFLNVMVISRKITFFKERAKKSLVKYTDWIEVSLKEKSLLSVYDAKEFVYEKIEKQSLNILKENMKAHNRMCICNALYAFSGMLGYLLLLFRGSDIIEEDKTDLAGLTKMTQYRSETVRSVNCIYSSVNNMNASIVGVRRINEIIGGENNG
ncbi:MAG: hypothetical protein K5988_09085 [Lachnospiraceae bacterium]|nr:hypothetical protein [Lachnospiraceae bacterium]